MLTTAEVISSNQFVASVKHYENRIIVLAQILATIDNQLTPEQISVLKDCLADANKKLRTRTDLIKNFLEETEAEFLGNKVFYPVKIYPEIMDKKLSEIFSTRIINCLQCYLNIYLVGDLVQLRPSNLKDIPGLGKTSIAEIQKYLSDNQLSFNTPLPGWKHPSIYR